MTTTSCECGCDSEVEDEVIQFLIEEALLERLELEEGLEKARELEQREAESAVANSQSRLQKVLERAAA